MNKVKIATTVELSCAFLSDSLKADENAFLMSEPHSYVRTKAQIDIPNDIDLHVVQNNTETVNLALPYYTGVGKPSAMALDDEAFEDIKGGEVLVAVCLTITAVCSVSGLVTSFASAGAVTYMALKDGEEDK